MAKTPGIKQPTRAEIKQLRNSSRLIMRTCDYLLAMMAVNGRKNPPGRKKVKRSQTHTRKKCSRRGCGWKGTTANRAEYCPKCEYNSLVKA